MSVEFLPLVICYKKFGFVTTNFIILCFFSSSINVNVNVYFHKYSDSNTVCAGFQFIDGGTISLGERLFRFSAI